jgi:hypothetical protein
MYRPWLLSHLLAVLVFSTSAQATDLSKIERTIKKEPTYSNKPSYCLLVFGPEAKTRVWVVLDGDVVYVDRNGNGDLTEEGERISATKARKIETPGVAFAQTRYFEVGDVDIGGRKATIRLHQFVPKKDLSSVSKENEGIRKDIMADPDLPWISVRVLINGKIRQNALLGYANRPQDAPIIHFDGPLTFGLRAQKQLVRGKNPPDFYVMLGTPGLGKDIFAEMTYSDVPENLHPSMVIEFPSKEKNGRAIQMTIALSQRC